MFCLCIPNFPVLLNTSGPERVEVLCRESGDFDHIRLPCISHCLFFLVLSGNVNLPELRVEGKWKRQSMDHLSVEGKNQCLDHRGQSVQTCFGKSYTTA